MTNDQEQEMGDHRSNKRAILKAMLPTFPVGSDFTHVELRGGFVLRRGLIITAPEKMRVAEGGAVEVLVNTTADGVEEWAAPPDGFTAIAEGEKLGYEHLDYVIHVMGAKITRNVVSRDGGHPMQQAPVTELLRMPAGDFLAKFGLGQGPEVNGAPAPLIVAG